MRSQRGFTLIEIMIAVGLAGLLALISYEVVGLSLKAKNSSEATLELAQVIKDLANPKSSQDIECTPLDPSGAAMQFNETEATSQTGMSFQMVFKAKPGMPEIVYKKGEDISGTKLKMLSLRYADAVKVGTDPSGKTMWAGTLKIQTEQTLHTIGSTNSKETYGGSAFLAIVDASGNISNCEMMSSTPNACEKIGGSDASGTCVLPVPDLRCPVGQVAFGYDGVTKTAKCRALTWSCPAGEAVAGFDQGSGNVVCVPPPPSCAPSPNTFTCTGGAPFPEALGADGSRWAHDAGCPSGAGGPAAMMIVPLPTGDKWYLCQDCGVCP